MKSKNPAIQVLRDATRDAHAMLEQSLVITRTDAGRAEYVAYLMALFGWLSPFEERLWSASWPDEMHVERRRGKCAWIEEDLESAGVTVADIPRCCFSPDLSTLPARVGVAYVIEGSQLGTKVLSRSLTPRLNGWTPRWLQGYGSDTAENWRDFLNFIEKNLRSQDERCVAASAAVAAFASLSAWFAICPPAVGLPLHPQR